MSSQTRPIKDLWLWSSARQEFVQAQLRNLFQHVSIPYWRSITFSVVIVFLGVWGCVEMCASGCGMKFLSDLSHWASVASGRAGFDREDDEWLRTEYVGTRWYRAPEARGERMLILSGIFELLEGGEKKPWMRQNNWLQVSTNHSQTSWRLWRSVSERIPTKHPQSFATRFSIFGFPRWCSPPRNTQLLLICGASVAYWESLWAERSCFLPRSAIISMNISSFEQYAGVWHGICYIWSSCCPFCCIFSQYCRRQSLSSNVEMRLSTGLKAVTLSIKSTRFVRSWEHLRHWGVLRG